MPGPLIFTQEWADAAKEYWNNDSVTREQTKGLNIKLWYVSLGWHGKDMLMYWKWDDGFMEEFKIVGEAPAPCEEWRKLKFDRKGYWGGFTAICHAGMDALDPVGDPPKPRETLLQILSDPRVRLDQSATEAYKIMKQLQGWLDGMARAQRALDFERPGYVPGSKKPAEPVW